VLSGRERERRHDRKREREKERERREREIEREFYLKHSIRGGLGRRPRRTPQGEEEGFVQSDENEVDSGRDRATPALVV
jgi:hypothetical protein